MLKYHKQVQRTNEVIHMKYTVEDMIKELESRQNDTDKPLNDNESDKKTPNDTEDLYKENALDLAVMTKKEKRKLKKETFKKRLETMSMPQRVLYTIRYYKWYGFGVLALLLLIRFAIVTAYNATRPTELYLALLNDNYNTTATEYIQNEYRQYNHLGDNNFIKIYNDLTFESSDKLEEVGIMMNAYQQVGYYNMYDMLDVIIGDEEALKVYTWSDDTTAIDLSMDTELYEQIKDHVVTLSDESKRKNDGKPYDVALDISDTEFVRNCNLSYEKVYLFIPSTKYTNNEATIQFIKMVFGL